MDQNESGDYESEKTKRMRTGNKYLRYYLIQAADSVRKHDSVYRDDYQKKYQEVPKHQHKRSLVLTARKLVRLVCSLQITDQLYIPPSIYCFLVESFFSAPFFKTYLFMKKLQFLIYLNLTLHRCALQKRRTERIKNLL